MHRFRTRAEGLLVTVPTAEWAYFDAYASGFNAAAPATNVAPSEYQVIGATPEHWRPADSLLVICSIFFELIDERGERDALPGLPDERLPPELVAFLTPPGTPWDAPMLGKPRPVAPIPRVRT